MNLSTKRFDGQMGQFQRREIDIGENALFMRRDRVQNVDFVAETRRIRACIMFRQPPLSAVTNIFALTFESQVWMSILIFMCVTSGVIVVIYFFTGENVQMHIFDCVMFVLCALCQQGFYVNILSKSGRVLVFTTFLSSVFLFTSFSANIVALLQTPSDAINSLLSLTGSQLDVGLSDTVYNRIYFNVSLLCDVSLAYRY